LIYILQAKLPNFCLFFNHHALLLLAMTSQFTAGARYLQVSKELGICEDFPLKETPVGVNLNG